MAGDDLILAGSCGLGCEAGGFWVDPSSPVPLAVITHAHADHATAGCGRYVATPGTAALLRSRLGGEIEVEELAFGAVRSFGSVGVSLHPAGHVLGSAQVRVEPARGPVWCVSGDYKTEPGPTAEAFEPVPCDVFVTESTFGLPVFRWPEQGGVAGSMLSWWRANAASERTSALLAYSLGKAQRVMASLAGAGELPGVIGVHGAVEKLCRVYEGAGVSLPDYVHASKATADSIKGTGLVVAPPAQAGTPWLRGFAGDGGMGTAQVSGWATIRGRRRWQALDTGFVLSDHADWPGLLHAIEMTGAQRVGVTHGYTRPFSRYLREERGLDSFMLATRWGDEDAE
ncbi:MAG: ligase-associated DNA damage response exonuclease [Planctomycetota bacterium]